MAGGPLPHSEAQLDAVLPSAQLDVDGVALAPVPPLEGDAMDAAPDGQPVREVEPGVEAQLPDMPAVADGHPGELPLHAEAAAVVGSSGHAQHRDGKGAGLNYPLRVLGRHHDGADVEDLDPGEDPEEPGLTSLEVPLELACVVLSVDRGQDPAVCEVELGTVGEVRLRDHVAAVLVERDVGAAQLEARTEPGGRLQLPGAPASDPEVVGEVEERPSLAAEPFLDVSAQVGAPTRVLGTQDVTLGRRHILGRRKSGNGEQQDDAWGKKASGHGSPRI